MTDSPVDPQREGVLISEIYRDAALRVLGGAFEAIEEGEWPRDRSVDAATLRQIVFPPPAPAGQPGHPLAKLRKMDGAYAKFVREHAQIILVQLTTANPAVDAVIPRTCFFGVPEAQASAIGEAFRAALISVADEIEAEIEDFLERLAEEAADEASRSAQVSEAPGDGL